MKPNFFCPFNFLLRKKTGNSDKQTRLLLEHAVTNKVVDANTDISMRKENSRYEGKKTKLKVNTLINNP